MLNSQGAVALRSLCVRAQPGRVALVKALGPLWRGVYYSRFAPLGVIEQDLPALPPGWVRVRNQGSGICGSDLHLLFMAADLGVHPAILPGNRLTYLGHEVVSTVTAVGPGVTALRPGDRVIRQGGWSCLALGLEPCPRCKEQNYNLCERQRSEGPVGGGWGDEYSAAQGAVLKVPDALSNDQAILVEPAACALRGVLRRPPAKGDRVLLLGIGTMGLFALQAARAAQPDCHITALVQFPYQQDLARRHGADAVWFAGPDIYEKAAAHTGGTVFRGLTGKKTLVGGFDKVYDCVGAAGTVQQALRLTRAGGAVVIIGVSLKPMQIDLTPVWYSEVDLIGTISHGYSALHGERLSDYERAVRWLLTGRLSIDGFVTHRFPLARYKEAITAAVDKRRAKSVKVVFDIS